MEEIIEEDEILEDAKLMKCEICQETQSSAIFLKLKCRHTACVDCLIDHFLGNLQESEGRFKKMRCINPRCGRIPTLTEVREFFEARGKQFLFDQFLSPTVPKTLEKGPKRPCPKRSTGNCDGEGFLYLKEDSESDEENAEEKLKHPKWFECGQCSDQYCGLCGQEVHLGMSCNQKRIQDNIYTDELTLTKQKQEVLKDQLKSNTIACFKCPSCKTAFERLDTISGNSCIDLHCPKCLHSWCNFCGHSLNGSLLHHKKMPFHLQRCQIFQ